MYRTLYFRYPVCKKYVINIKKLEN